MGIDARYLETQYDYLRQIASGGGSTKGALTCAFLRGLPLPLPPLDEQREIVAILDAIDRKIELHQQKRAVLEDLFKALLHKLMTGEIALDELDLLALDRVTTNQGALVSTSTAVQVVVPSPNWTGNLSPSYVVNIAPPRQL